MSASTGSRLILIGFLLLTAIMLVIVLGPLGLILVPLGLIIVGLVLVTVGDDEDEAVPDRVNCADCGARNDADDETCDYCGAAL